MFVVVYGGSGSGKSEFAETLTVDYCSGVKYCIATMQPFDDESYKKIDRHRRMRKEKNFETIECQTNLQKAEIKQGSTVLLECMSNLTANEMYSDNGAKENTVSEILKGLEHLKKAAKNIVVVTNNIFDDGDNYDEDSIRYMNYLAQINNEMSRMADEVYEVVHGIALKIK